MATEAWFLREEYLARVGRVQAELARLGLDALLAFQPESVTYLTGFFTRGYSTFQFAIVPARGEPAVLCRDVERYYLDTTCVFGGRALWSDGEDRQAAAAAFIRGTVGPAARCGVELSAWQLHAQRYEALRQALPRLEWCDTSELVARLRLIKSPAELAYQRRAGKAAEAGMAAGRAAARVGTSEREMAAQICAAMIRAGSDCPGPGVLASGERAFHLHGGYSDRVLEAGDTVQLECTPCVRHYHARFMRTFKVSQASPEDRALAAQLIAIQDKALAEVGPGVSAAVPDRIYRDGVLGAGLAQTYTNKTFYSVGLQLAPSGGESLEAAPGCRWRFEAGMTFHTYVLARSFGFSETIAITPAGYERLTTYPRELCVT
jgi:Xaa-Pro dipeptidase